MKISELFIQNFRSIKREHIVFPDSGILALVGPNNAGKSNILRAINNMLGDTWFNGEKAELNDYYNKTKENNIIINMKFDNNYMLKFNSDENRAKYFDERGSQIFSTNGNVKDDFPCTYLPASRGLEKSLQFRSYELMGKIAKKFNEKAQVKKQEIETKFNEIMDIFDTIEGFTDFKNDFTTYFDEIQCDSPYKLKVNFKAFTPLNYFKTLHILANDSTINQNFDMDVDELGEGNKSLLLFALVRSYAKNFKQHANGILAIEEPEIYLHPQARRYLFDVFREIVDSSNIQIVYTTHSPDFVYTEYFDSIGIVSKSSEDGTKVKITSKLNLVNFCEATGVTTGLSTVDNIGDFYSTTADFRLNEGFFAKKLLLF